jgi:hypothetical protein
MAWPPQSRPPHVPPPRPRMPPVHPLPSSMPLRRPCIAATTTTTPSSQPHTPWFPPPKKLASQKHLRADHCQSKLELRGRSDHGRQSAPSHLRPLPGLAKMRPNLINFSLNSCLSGSFGKGNGPVRRHNQVSIHPKGLPELRDPVRRKRRNRPRYLPFVW